MATSAQAIKYIFDAYPDSELVDEMEDASKRGSVNDARDHVSSQAGGAFEVMTYVDGVRKYIGYVVIVFDVCEPDEQLADYGGEIMKTLDAQEN